VEGPRTIRLGYLLVVGLAAAVHLPTVRYPFVLDDRVLIVENAFLREPLSPLTAFGHHFWHGTPGGAFYYRPIVIASLAINRWILGDQPAGFHLVNVLLHGANAALLLALLRKLEIPARSATLAACAFALHPATAWPVSSVVARVDLLPALFILLAWLALARPAPVLAGLAFLGALLCKESAAAFLGVPLLAARAPLRRRERSRGWAGVVGVVAAFGVYLALRLAAGLGIVPMVTQMRLSVSPLVVNPILGMEGGERFRAALALSGKYLLYLLVPVRFSDAAAYGPHAAGPGWFSPGVVLGAVLLGGGALLALALWLRRDRLGLFLGFSLAGFLPASNLLFPIGSLYALNFLYLPLLGVCLALGDVLGRIESRARAAGGLAAARNSTERRGAAFPRRVTLASTPILALLGLATVLEDRIWRDETALLGAWTARFPNYPLGWSALGWARARGGDLAAGEDLLREALRLEERNDDAHYNLGVILMQTAKAGETGRLEEALQHHRRVIELSPDRMEARINAANLLIRLDRPAEAESEARAGLERNPSSAPLRGNLAEALFRQRRYEEAVPLFRELSGQFPADPGLRSPFVVSLLHAGRLDEARAEAEAARKDFPDLAWFDFCLARIEARAGRPEAARDLLRRARDRDPQVEEWIRQVHDFDHIPEARSSVLRRDEPDVR
jgi:tetratricopeptide (TPR) repeat protein